MITAVVACVLLYAAIEAFLGEHYIIACAAAGLSIACAIGGAAQ